MGLRVSWSATAPELLQGLHRLHIRQRIFYQKIPKLTTKLLSISLFTKYTLLYITVEVIESKLIIVILYGLNGFRPMVLVQKFSMR